MEKGIKLNVLFLSVAHSLVHQQKQHKNQQEIKVALKADNDMAMTLKANAGMKMTLKAEQDNEIREALCGPMLWEKECNNEIA